MDFKQTTFIRRQNPMDVMTVFSIERLRAQITRSLLTNGLCGCISHLDEIIVSMLEISSAMSLNTQDKYLDLPPWEHNYSKPSSKHDPQILQDDLYCIIMKLGHDNLDDIEAFVIEASMYVDDSLLRNIPDLHDKLYEEIDIMLIDNKSVLVVTKNADDYFA